MTARTKYYLPGKLIRDSVPKVCIGGWSWRLSVPSTYPNSRLPEGNQVLSINHIDCTSSLSTLNPSFRGSFISVWGNCLSAKFPDTSQAPNPYRQDSSLRPARLSLFWTHTPLQLSQNCHRLPYTHSLPFWCLHV